jgi:hypothetical protein
LPERLADVIELVNVTMRGHWQSLTERGTTIDWVFEHIVGMSMHRIVD